MSSEPIILNVGGKRYETSISTLTRVPGYLKTCFESELNKPNNRGEYFIDRNPDIFASILNYLRTDYVIFPPGISEEQLIIEFDFFFPSNDNQKLFKKFLSDENCTDENCTDSCLKTLIYTDFLHPLIMRFVNQKNDDKYPHIEYLFPDDSRHYLSTKNTLQKIVIDKGSFSKSNKSIIQNNYDDKKIFLELSYFNMLSNLSKNNETMNVIREIFSEKYHVQLFDIVECDGQIVIYFKF